MKKRIYFTYLFIFPLIGCSNISINGSAYITEENKNLIGTETKYGEFKNSTETLKGKNLKIYMENII